MLRHLSLFLCHPNMLKTISHPKGLIFVIQVRIIYSKRMKSLPFFALLIISFNLFHGIALSQNLTGPEANLDQKIRAHHISREEFAYYQILNNKEHRLSTYRDDDLMLLSKIILLHHINESRRKYSVPSLKLNILASRVANKMSRKSCDNGFFGHWNLQGEKPYHRYAFAGGTDHVSENASALITTGRISPEFDNIVKLMENAHSGFMEEKAPNDGHKQTVIGPFHNYVGIGMASCPQGFRYYEEYLDRYLQFGPFQQTIKKGETAAIQFRLLDKKLYPYAIIGYYEPPLKLMTRDQINRLNSYNDFTEEIAFQLWPWEIPSPNRDGYITIRKRFNKKGLYYIQIYLSKEPYQGGRRASNRGKIQASGIVIKVE